MTTGPSKTALKPGQQTDLVLPVPDGGYMPGIGPSDLAMPEFRLMQGQSAAVQGGIAKVGEFYSAQTGRVVKEIPCIVLLVRRTRILWQADELGKPRCFSHDGVNGSPGGEFEGTLCSTCSLAADAPWTLTQEQKKNACLLGYSFLCVELPEDTGNQDAAPFIFRVGGTGVRNAQNFITALRMSFKSIPFAVKTTWRASGRSNKYGTFYVANPVISGPVNAELRSRLQVLANGLASQQVDWAPTGATSTGEEGAEPGFGAPTAGILFDDPAAAAATPIPLGPAAPVAATAAAPSPSAPAPTPPKKSSKAKATASAKAKAAAAPPNPPAPAPKEEEGETAPGVEPMSADAEDDLW